MPVAISECSPVMTSWRRSCLVGVSLRRCLLSPKLLFPLWKSQLVSITPFWNPYGQEPQHLGFHARCDSRNNSYSSGVADSLIHIAITQSDGVNSTLYLCLDVANSFDTIDNVYTICLSRSYSLSSMAFSGICYISYWSCGWAAPSIQFSLFWGLR